MRLEARRWVVSTTSDVTPVSRVAPIWMLCYHFSCAACKFFQPWITSPMITNTSVPESANGGGRGPSTGNTAGHQHEIETRDNDSLTHRRSLHFHYLPACRRYAAVSARASATTIIDLAAPASPQRIVQLIPATVETPDLHDGPASIETSDAHSCDAAEIRRRCAWSDDRRPSGQRPLEFIRTNVPRNQALHLLSATASHRVIRFALCMYRPVPTETS